MKRRPQGEGCLLSLLSVTFLILAVLLLLSFSGCTSPTKVVTVPEVHELHHWHSDTIRQTDSVVKNQTTVIREVDSATMAQYGIRLDNPSATPATLCATPSLCLIQWRSWCPGSAVRWSGH